ncbi:hypothetical protein MTR_3g435560 [Medicago truncatula]|uniref:Uncharacterized protein n=1 Tax=Medicago truncatula TaxID=3880 RepID=A0A072V560_MEDTR|nr:hypothetical protein MTR_3g435560 [Medicago truncatula]
MPRHPSNAFFSISYPARKQMRERATQSLACSVRIGYTSGTLITKPISKKKLRGSEEAAEIDPTPLTPFFLMQAFSVLTRSAHSVVDSQVAIRLLASLSFSIPKLFTRIVRC